VRFVDLETARNASGLRLVVLADVPSPWSQAAKAIIELKGIDAVAVRMPLNDAAVRSWTGVRNAPVALYEDEPPRSGWAEILALAERLQPEPALIPHEPRERALMHGLSHELMGEGGVLWCSRLLTIDNSIASDGKHGYPVPVARYLGARYGYAPGCGARARACLVQALSGLDEQLQIGRAAGPYYFGERRSALDIYSAMAVNTLALLPPQACPMHPVLRDALEWLQGELADAVPSSLIEHRDMMFSRHLALPIEL